MAASPETVRHMHHDQREIGRIGAPCRRDVPAVCHPPVLCGLPEVTLDVETSAIVVSSRVVGDLLVAAAQDHRPPGWCVQVRRDADDDRQRVCECLVEPWRLVPTRLDVALHRGVFEVWWRDGGVLPLAALRAMWPPPSRGASRGAVPRRIVPPRGHQGPVALSRHLQGVVVATGPVQHHVGQRERPGDAGQHGLKRPSEAPSLRRASHVGLGCVLAALWTSRATPGGGRLLRLRWRVGRAGNLLRVATDALLDAERARAARLSADQRSGATGPPGHRRAVQTGAEPSQPIGVLASSRDDHFIPSSQVHLLWTVHMRPTEHPKQRRPRDHGGEKPLYRAVTATLPSPARHTQPRDSSRQDQQSRGDPAELAPGGDR